MAENLSAQLNLTPGCIPSKWTRYTVADGDWLQAKTLKPLSSRDNWLAEKIEELSGNISDDLDEEISARIAGDTYLSGAILQTNIRIDNIEAATDVIAVFGTFNEFSAASASEWQQTVTDKDFIKVLRDDTVSSNQVYYEYHSSAYAGWEGWSAIGTLDPYYSVNEINSFSSTLSSTIANNYLSAKGAVLTGRNIDITEDPNYPKITIATKDEVNFDKVSATTAYGSSAKFTNISATNILANNFRSEFGNVYAWTLDFISANGINLTASKTTVIDLNAAKLNDYNVDSLIGSAQSGKYAYNVISGAKFSAVGTTTSTAYLSGGFGIEAGQGVGVSLNGKNVVITAEGTTYNDSTYISTANKTISVKSNLIGSAQSGKKAYDYVTNSATFVAGPGISFYSAGQNQLGISADGQSLVPGRCIAIGQDNSINLSSDIIVDNISANQKLYLSGNNDGNYYTATLTYSSVDMVKDGQPGPELHFNSYEVSSVVAGQSHQAIRSSITWNEITTMNNRFVSASPNAAGSKLLANNAITFVVTSTLPTQIPDNTYYIV